MNELFSNVPLAWLVTYFLHSTLLLGAVWLLESAEILRRTASRELAWHGAFLGAIITASVHVFAPDVSLAGRASLDLPALSAPTKTIIRSPADSKTDISPDTADVHAPTATRSPASTETRVSAITKASALDGLLLVWLCVSALLAIRLLVTGLRAVNELRDRERIIAGAVHVRLAALCARENAAPRQLPKLAVVDGLPGPVTLPNGEICLPRWALHVPEEQLDAMLAHELAHVRRYDPLLSLGVTLLASLLFFQPLNRLAQRRLSALAEMRADLFAAQLTGNPRALAQALAECAEQLQFHRTAPHTLRVGVAMATSRSPLIARVERLLGDIAMNDLISSPHARGMMLAALLGAVLLLPAFGAGPVNAEGRHSISIEHDDDRKTLKLEIGKAGYFLHVEADGEIAFTPDESDIARLDDGAKISIREKRDGVLHEFTAVSHGGQINRSYSRNGKSASPGDARAWLAVAIPEVLRNTAINARARVARLLSEGGVEAVLDEMALIDPDHALRRYSEELLGAAELEDDEVNRLLALLESVGSDFEMRNVLVTLHETQTLSDANRVQLLRTATSIGSDFELAELLMALSPQLALDAATRTAWQELAASLGSDFEMRRALGAMVARGDAAPEWTKLVLELGAEHIGSDFELRSLLTEIAPHVGDDVALQQAYLAAVAAIASDFEAREALIAYVREAKLDDAGYAALLEAVSEIGADFEALQVLRAIAKRMPREESLLRQYREAAGELASHERAQAEDALR